MVSTYYRLDLLASTYGSGSYNTSNYNGSTTTGGTGSASGGSNGGSLSNTGVYVAGIVTVAALLLLIAMVVRVWRRPSKKASSADSDEG